MMCNEFSRTILSRQERLKRFLYLAIALVPVMASYSYNHGLKIPFSGCPLLRFTGIPCPAWGMTRSFMAIARGDWEQAIAYHLFGPVLFLAFLIAEVHLVLELGRGRRIHALYLPWVRNPKIQIFAFLVLLSYHCSRLYVLAQSGELYTAFVRSPFGQFW